MTEPFEEIPTVNDFVRYRLGYFMIVVGLVLGTGLMVALTESQFDHSIVGSIGTLRDASQPNIIPEEAAKAQPEIVGTSGRVAPSAVVHEMEALTSAPSVDAIVGRSVSLTVPVLGRNTDQAFWIGSGDHQMLVVVRRDHRTPAERYYGETTSHHIADLPVGGEATITGTVQQIPSREEMYSWGLTTTDIAQLEARPVYIAADSVQPAQ